MVGLELLQRLNPSQGGGTEQSTSDPQPFGKTQKSPGYLRLNSNVGSMVSAVAENNMHATAAKRSVAAIWSESMTIKGRRP